MPAINMIAPRRAERRRLERDMRRLLILIVVEMVFAVGVGGWLCTRLFTTRAQIADLEVQLTRLQPVVSQIERYEKATGKLEPKLKLLDKAKDNTLRWYNTLDRLTQCMPESAWLTQISSRADRAASGSASEGLSMDIRGISANQATVGEAMLRINTIPDLKRVDLSFTQSSTVGNATAVEFEINAAMKAAEDSRTVRDRGSGTTGEKGEKEVKRDGSGQS